MRERGAQRPGENSDKGPRGGQDVFSVLATLQQIISTIWLGLHKLFLEKQGLIQENLQLSQQNTNLEQALADARKDSQNLAQELLLRTSDLVVQSIEKKGLEGQLEVSQEEALTDHLTGLSNRRDFYVKLEAAIHIMKRHKGRRYIFLLLDLDHFKRYNDQYGHLAGDAALKTAAQVILDSVRGEDLVSRWGGEEFAIIAELQEGEIDPAKAAHILGERIRSAIQGMVLNVPGANLTVSIGGTIMTHRDIILNTDGSIDLKNTIDPIIQRTDVALYSAKGRGEEIDGKKELGRNRVIFVEDLINRTVQDMFTGEETIIASPA